MFQQAHGLNEAFRLENAERGLIAPEMGANSLVHLALSREVQPSKACVNVNLAHIVSKNIRQ